MPRHCASFGTHSRTATAGTGRVGGVRAVRDGENHDITARLVIGCDGRGSTCRIREGIGAGRVRRYSHDLFSFDIENPPDLPPRLIAYVTRQGLRLVYPMPHGRARMYIQIVPGGARRIRRQGLGEWLVLVAREVPALGDVIRSAIARPGRPQALPAERWTAPRWSVPGLVLIGDAAHGVHPMAGQGMNAAIGDAWALGQALVSAGRNDGARPPTRAAAIDAAVRAYEGERRPQIAYISRMSHHLALAFTETSRVFQALSRRMMTKNSENERMKQITTMNIAGLGIRPFTFKDRFYQLGILRGPHAGAAT